MSGVLDSQRAWVGHGAMHDDSPPRRLAPARQMQAWDGEPFEEDTLAGDDWFYDDPYYSARTGYSGAPQEDGSRVFDSRDGTRPDEFDPEERDDPWADGPYGDF